jgi:hypothetical protein
MLENQGEKALFNLPVGVIYSVIVKLVESGPVVR